VTADRGYGEASVEAKLGSLGVKTVAIPRKGRPGPRHQATERARAFRSLVKWRTGSEGRISSLKRSWGFDRTLLDGTAGTMTWCSWGMLASNLDKIATLLDERDSTPHLRLGSQPPMSPDAIGPPKRGSRHANRLVILPSLSASSVASFSPLTGKDAKRGGVRDGNGRSRRSDGSLLWPQPADQTSFFRSK
jgi:hypothetical protein